METEASLEEVQLPSETQTGFLKSYNVRGNIVRVGDTVVMRHEDADDTYVALVRGFQADPNEAVKVETRRYYRPEDTVAGRKPFHGSRELFLTDHYDNQNASTILEKCVVNTFTNYTLLKDVRPIDYFSRFEYQTETGWFSPDAVEVVCKCEMPVNPDVFMLKCEACRELYHPVCLNMTTDQAKQLVLDNYTCDDCRSLDGKRSHDEGSASTDLSMVE
ncbi:bromo adjacent homology (BAH) domain, Zinc finger, RING/FYVE/PHD-type [Artemisia annua]|uniref:Bromo adjacent homology (BAH) domain, Zinc finger, RING/FYVE/PHD-type n=1 Tax=Artemisia annua TaxID=35608 RepID=A0A2U1MF01_ARTAN|nr:bromo adjacent homology (BAH) domain, Zinc finger, RING/FYVE/PHD-type [Artemisia annua]